MLTTADGPVVISPRTLGALLALRREKLLPQLVGPVVINAAGRESLRDVLPHDPEWLSIRGDQPQVALPSRLVEIPSADAQTLQLALACGASLVLLEGAAKEKAKLSFIKCEGVVSLLVRAYREGLLTAVPPMLKALTALGFADVLPREEALTALLAALAELR